VTGEWRELQAWAGTRTARSWVLEASSAEECALALKAVREKGLKLCLRSGAYSYSDQILHQDQAVLDASKMDRILDWDLEKGLLRVEGGTSLGAMLGKVLPDGWTVPTSVGIPGVTAAGALSNDVHGKNSWKVGSFSDHVVSFKLMTADGSVREGCKEKDPELFSAVAGGMGLLGVILEVTLRCKRVPSPFVETQVIPTRCLKESVELLEGMRDTEEYMTAWVDAFASGPELGRGFVWTARYVEAPGDGYQERLAAVVRQGTRVFGLFPAGPTWALLRPFYGRLFVRCGNIVRYHMKRRKGRERRTVLFPEFNFMHNLIPGVNQVYAPHGFLEFQPMLPRAGGVEGMEAILRLCQQRGTQSLLCGFKVNKPGGGLLSFTGDTYSMGIDVALRGRSRREMEAFSRELFGMVADAGGKAYLAKDELLSRADFEKMYPSHGKFMEVKRRLDPDGLFASDMYNRLLAPA